MNTSDQKPLRPTPEQLRVDLRRLDWGVGLSEESLTAITNTAEWVEFHTGEVILEIESEITHMYFLITGRVQSTLHDALGKEIEKDTIVPGLAIALLAIGSSDPSLLHVEALEPSTAIRLDAIGPAAASSEACRLSTCSISLGGERVQAIRDGRSFPSQAIHRGHHSSQRVEPFTGGSIGTSTERAGRVSGRYRR